MKMECKLVEQSVIPKGSSSSEKLRARKNHLFPCCREMKATNCISWHASVSWVCVVVAKNPKKAKD